MAKKVPKKKIAQAVAGMAAKAMEIGWSPTMPAAEKLKAQEEPEFVYVLLDHAWGPWKKGKSGNEGGFVLRWGAKGVGFGEFTFYLKKKGKKVEVGCDTECMSQKFVRAAMNHFVSTAVPKLV